MSNVAWVLWVLLDLLIQVILVFRYGSGPSFNINILDLHLSVLINTTNNSITHNILVETMVTMIKLLWGEDFCDYKHIKLIKITEKWIEGEADVVLGCVWGVSVLLGQLGNMENRLRNNSLNPDRLLQASCFLLHCCCWTIKRSQRTHSLSLSLSLSAQTWG